MVSGDYHTTAVAVTHYGEGKEEDLQGLITVTAAHEKRC